jgi:hypothetical protein
MTVTGSYAILSRCTTAGITPLTPSVAISQPQIMGCDYRQAQINVTFPAPYSASSIMGTLNMKYARTWIDVHGPLQTQVWRFLVNGSLTCQGPVPQMLPSGLYDTCYGVLPPCVIISLGGADYIFGDVYFEGHIDYTCTGEGNSFGVSMSLSHHKGKYTHAPGTCGNLTSSYPHTYDGYHLVAPGPFVWGPGTPPAGAILYDAVRASVISTTYDCLSEVEIAPGGQLTSASNLSCIGVHCNLLCPQLPCELEQYLSGPVCPDIGVPGMWYQGVSIPNSPLPASGFVAFTLGRWSGLGSYPWSAQLNQYLGTVTTSATTCIPANSLHVVVGVGVSDQDGGLLGLPFDTTGCVCSSPTTPTLSPAFIDLNNVLPLPNAQPGYGCAAASTLVLNLNL